MFVSNNRISGRQVMRLLTFDLLGYSALMIPSTLADEAGTDGIFSLLLGIGAGFIYLFLLKKVVSRISSTYSNYINEICGKFWGNLIKAGYILYFILLAGRVADIFAELVGKELLEEQFSLILIVILVLTFYGVVGGIEGRARVYEILFWIVLIPLLVMMIATIPTVDTDYWTPLFIATKEGVLRGGYDTFLGCSILFLLPFLAEYVKKRESLYVCGKWALFVTGGILCLLYLILLGMFGSAALASMDYPAVTMMSRVQITGGFLKRVDAIMFGIWFFTLYALLNSLVFFCGKLCMEFFKPIEKHSGHKWMERICLLGEIVLVFFVANAFYGVEGAKVLFEKYYWYIGTPFIVVVPMLLLFLSGKKSNMEKISLKEKRHAGEKNGNMKYKVVIGGIVFLMFFLTACASAEVEEREFPVLLEVTEEENFAKEWLNSLQQGNKKIDYNHLKVVLISKNFLENENAMSELLQILKRDKNVPLNAYVVTTEQWKEVSECGEKLDESLGDYIEKLLENSDGIKKETFPTIGMLYQEQENQVETLFIPLLSLVDEKPEITAYEVYKRGKAVGNVDTDAALLSFFINNQLEEYVLQLGQKEFVRLFGADNEISFEEHVENSGLIRKRVRVDISCDGEIIYENVSGDANEVKRWLETQFGKYMKEKSATQLKRGIDLTNSKKKLGNGMRKWHERYQTMQDAYEEDIEIVFDVSVRWVND